ncbi:RhoGAP protein-like protein [Calycina marina]|uniref:RhoGAP protein-like protein n=1 Tax=Calycina marina TaxID=1763456 RepID=A0A9P7Z5T6_9HELO|nr:RhoGAP protein-like protein [Calycina marina]
MATDFPSWSSSQQPYAQPQPVPAASPPTKQSLKSWWKGFRPPAKTQETPGNYPHLTAQDSRNTLAAPLRRTGCASRFHESSMDVTSPHPDGVPDTRPGQTIVGGNGRERSEVQDALVQTPLAQSLPNNYSSAPLLNKKSHLELRALPASNASVTLLGMSAPVSLIAEDSRSPLLYNSSFLFSSSGPSNESQPLLGPVAQANNKKSVRFCKALAKVRSIIVPPSGIFGVPLRTSITYANVAISLVDNNGKSYIYGYVPIVVAKCGVYLKEKATNVEGIFRLSGSAKRIKELAAIFDSPDRYGKGLDWAGYTVHDAANVLRRYLNNLPEPIVPLDLYDSFRKPLKGHTTVAVGDSEGPQLEAGFDVGAAIRTYQQLITELPPLNRQLLLYILDLLAVFASKSDENRMTSANLAAIFQPGMLSHPMHDMAPAEYRLSQDVLIFLIENQDHFLIGMSGTEADETTVNEIQSGAATPTTPSRNSNAVGRSSSSASAGADSIRKFGGVRRNVSVSSRHSRQSNGAPSPATPTYGSQGSGGVHRSNTVPSKRSPNIAQGRLNKQPDSPSPSAAVVAGNLAAQPQAAPRGLSPVDPNAALNRTVSPTSPAFAPSLLGPPSAAPSSLGPLTITSQERLLGDADKQPESATPAKDRGLLKGFQRSPTIDSERKQPNKLKKKRIPSSSNPSAQSSTHSLHQGRSDSVSPGLNALRDVTDNVEHKPLETILSSPNMTEIANQPTVESASRDTSTHGLPYRSAEVHHSSDRTLKPKGSVSSLRTRSSFNDQSDPDHVDDMAATAEQKEKKSRWRMSRRREHDDSLSKALSPPRAFGSDAGAGGSSSSIGSVPRPRKSFTVDPTTAPDLPPTGAHPLSSNESSTTQQEEEKKGPLSWIKSKIREKRDDADKERAKSPTASTDRLPRGKSMDVKREDNPEKAHDEPLPQSQR